VATALNPPKLEWGAATMPLAGQNACGDQCVVETFEGGAMASMIDALGHGPEAAQVADAAAQVLSRDFRRDPVALIERCHAELRGTRGAAISIAAFDAAQATLTWVGVGNVAGTLLSADTRARPRELLTYGGVVGDRLPELTPSVLTVAAGDVLVLATDGVARHAELVLPPTADPQWLADRILDRFTKRTDDAAVMVLRINHAG
jgi:negative regulator of sigma-B (phosphoserine phosphatase)